MSGMFDFGGCRGCGSEELWNSATELTRFGARFALMPLAPLPAAMRAPAIAAGRTFVDVGGRLPPPFNDFAKAIGAELDAAERQGASA